jgi:hypothetical protein
VVISGILVTEIVVFGAFVYGIPYFALSCPNPKNYGKAGGTRQFKIFLNGL